MEQDSISYQTIMNQHKQFLFFFLLRLRRQSEDWLVQRCHNLFKRNYCVKVDEEGQKNITISYLIVQTSYCIILSMILSRKISVWLLFFSATCSASVSLSCCSYFFVLAFSGSTGTLQNFLMGGLKIAPAGSVRGWFMRLWVIQLCRSGMTAE